jgi:hypothetical protein
MSDADVAEKGGYTPPATAKSESQLEEELQAHLDDVGLSEGKEAEELDEDLEADLADESDEEEESTPDEDLADESDDDDEPTPDADESDEKPGEKVEIPDAFVRAAVHQGMSEDDVAELVESVGPEKAKKVLEKMYESTNRITGEFARLGRAEAERLKAEQTAKVQQEEQPQLDLTEVKAQYGEDDPLVKLIIQQQEQLQKTQQLQQPVQEPTNQVPQQQPVDASLKEKVDTFFSRDNMRGYDEFYGPGNDQQKWTQEQFTHRHKMLTLTDDIMFGARAQGRDMEWSEALEKAHMLSTDEIRAKVIREEIAKTVTKRSKSLSLKPKSSKQAIESGKPKNEGDLIARTAERLKILQ